MCEDSISVDLHAKEASGIAEEPRSGPGLVAQSRTPKEVLRICPGMRAAEKPQAVFHRKRAKAEGGARKKAGVTNEEWRGHSQSVLVKTEGTNSKKKRPLFSEGFGV